MRKLLLILSLVLTMFMFACGKDKDSNTMPEQNTPVETPTVNTPIETPTPSENPSIDITGVKFTSLTVDYDGQPHSITCENVPNGVTVSYEGNNVSEVGVHTVTAILKDSNGNELGRLTATITIIEVKEPTPVVVLGIPTLTIDEYGVVSEEVAFQMAKGVADKANSNVGVSITGLAGPSGGTQLKPVGMVCFGICINGNIITYTQYFGNIGRTNVRQKSVEFVIEKLIDLLS